MKFSIFKFKFSNKKREWQGLALTFNVKARPCHSNAGQAILTAVVFFMFISMIVVSGAYTVSYKESKSSRDFGTSKKSFFMAESGLEDLAYRMIKVRNYDTVEILSLDGFFATTTVAEINGGKEITATGTASKMIRKSKIKLANNDGVSFHYGVQVGEGGIVMENSSFVQGNIFSNGAIVGQNSNMVKGDIISAGPSGSVVGVHATGTVYAHIISNSDIDKDAYYATISNTTVSGVKYPGSPDQATSSLSVSDTQIDAWKTEAAAGGIISSPCPYRISSNITIGPVKINCNLEISGSPTVTIAGTVWVNGNIEIENSPIIKIDSSLGANSVAVIADNPSNRITSSKIELENSAQFQNSGTEGSYVLFVSQNNSAQTGGSEKAIRGENSISGEVLVYAGHGEVQLKNSVSLREVSAYKIRLSNSAQVIYETGIANLLFTSGPSGGYSIESWREGE